MESPVTTVRSVRVQHEQAGRELPQPHSVATQKILPTTNRHLVWTVQALLLKIHVDVFFFLAVA